MKVSDYVIKFLEELNVKTIFGLQGGNAMFLFNSLRKSKKIKFIPTLNEQSANIASDAYFQYTGDLGVCLTTSGPGATNTITGITASWLDSNSTLTIVGQSKSTTLRSKNHYVRQSGIQEVDFISMVRGITKYAECIIDPNKIKYHLEMAVFQALNGRKGPVVLEIPLDIQNEEIDENSLSGVEDCYLNITYDNEKLNDQVDEVIKLLNNSKRPVILAGNGIKLSNCGKQFRKLIECLNIPILITWKGMDLIDENHSLFFGRPGSIASRYANFIQQNSDLIICLGSKLDFLQIGFNYGNFAKNAKKIIIDIDNLELHKIEAEIKINNNVKNFIELLNKKSNYLNTDNQYSEWLAWCNDLKEKYPIILPEYKEEKKFVNTYHLIDVLSELATGDDIIIPASSGSASEITQQAWKVKIGQKIICNPGLGSMGFSLPHAIGACIASGNKRTICILGDGDLQHNLQELELVRRYELNIKFFVLNNNGYASIRNTANKFFEGNKFACDKESGLSLPPIGNIADAYNIDYGIFEKVEHLCDDNLEYILGDSNSYICEVMVDPNLQTQPKISSYTNEEGKIVSAPMEDLWPFLDREEFNEVIGKLVLIK